MLRSISIITPLRVFIGVSGKLLYLCGWGLLALYALNLCFMQEASKLTKSFETIFTLPKTGTRIFIDIPFNVWESFGIKGYVTVKGAINEVPYTCGLLPRGNGAYSLPFTKEMQKNTGAKLGDKLTITMAIDDTPKVEKQIDTSKAKKINNIELVMQPNPKACGQACIAMIANVSCEEVIKALHTSGPTSIGQLI